MGKNSKFLGRDDTRNKAPDPIWYRPKHLFVWRYPCIVTTCDADDILSISHTAVHLVHFCSQNIERN